MKTIWHPLLEQPKAGDLVWCPILGPPHPRDPSIRTETYVKCEIVGLRTDGMVEVNIVGGDGTDIYVNWSLLCTREYTRRWVG